MNIIWPLFDLIYSIHVCLIYIAESINCCSIFFVCLVWLLNLHSFCDLMHTSHWTWCDCGLCYFTIILGKEYTRTGWEYITYNQTKVLKKLCYCTCNLRCDDMVFKISTMRPWLRLHLTAILCNIKNHDVTMIATVI